jgi:hypothetical protein
MGFPIFDIDVGETRNKQFKFLLCENGNEIGGNDIMET